MNVFPAPFPLRAVINNGITSVLHGGATGAGGVQLSAGTTSSFRSDFTFSNSPSVTFGLNGVGVITASVAPAAGGLTNIKVSAGTLSALRSDITFNNSNGVSFGLNGAGVVTATVATNYQSAGAYLTTAQPPGAYLTTAALSQDSSKYAGIGFTSTTTAGTAVVATLNTSGLSMGIPKYLTGGIAGISFIQVSAGTGTNDVTALSFFDTDGVSWQLAGSTIRASVETNYQSPGAYLTTAMLSNASSVFAGTGLTTTTTAGTNIVGTLNTSGLSLGIPAYLTTAAVSGAINISAGTTSSNVGAVTFSNANGVSFGYDGTNVSASVHTNYQSPGAYLTTAQPPGAYLTTAMLSDASSVFAGIGFTSTTTAGTAVVATLNTSGLSMGIPAYLTTAAAAGLSAVNISAGTTSTNASAFTFSNSNNFTFGLGTGASAGMITVSYSDSDVWAGTNTSVATTGGTDLSFAVNTSGVTIAYPKWLTTAQAPGAYLTTAQPPGAYLTTAAATNVTSACAGTNTSVITIAGSDLTFAVNTSGVTIGYPKWLTSAAAGGGVAISNSQSLFSTGTVGFSEGGGAITIAGSTSAGGQSLMFSVPQTSSVVGSGMISIGTAGSTINISAPDTSSIIGNNLTISTNVSTISISAPATSSIVGLGGISISTNGSTITISYSSSNSSAPTIGYFENQPLFPINTTTISASGSVLQIVPFILPQPASIAFIRIPASFSFVSTSAAGTTANTSFTQNRSYTVAAVIYSNAGGNMSQIGSLTSSYASYVFQTSITAGATGSHYTLWNNVTYPVSGNYGNYATSVGFTNVSYQNSTGSLTLFTGLRWLDIPFNTSLSAGNYWLGIGCSNATATNAGPALTGASMNPISMYAQSQTNLTFMLQGAASNSSVQIQPGLGSFSTNASQMSNATIAMSNISVQSSHPKLYFQMIWST